MTNEFTKNPYRFQITWNCIVLQNMNVKTIYLEFMKYN